MCRNILGCTKFDIPSQDVIILMMGRAYFYGRCSTQPFYAGISTLAERALHKHMVVGLILPSGLFYQFVKLRFQLVLCKQYRGLEMQSDIARADSDLSGGICALLLRGAHRGYKHDSDVYKFRMLCCARVDSKNVQNCGK